MSLIAKIFGSGGKGGKAPTPQEAIQRLRETEEMLAKKQEFLEKKIEQELVTAKKNGTKNKRGEGKLADCVVRWFKLVKRLMLVSELARRQANSLTKRRNREVGSWQADYRNTKSVHSPTDSIFKYRF